MGTILGTLLSFGIVFAVLVFIHEFGHFFMAKLVKVRVEVFSWGYGKRLIGVKKGETDYRISMFPLGGYVKFSGEEVLDQKREMEPNDFMAKKRWERFLVMVMGSVMNVFLAVMLISIINMIGASVPEYQSQRPVIGWIESGSPAEQANLKIDDEILSINDKGTNTWRDVEIAIGTKPKRLIDLEIKRGERTLTVQLRTESKTKYEMGTAGFFGKIYVQVMVVNLKSPAEKAGMKAGDVILEINNEPVHFFQFVEIIENNPEKELEFLVEREGKPLTLLVTPRLEGEVGKIGIGQSIKQVTKKYRFFPAIVQSVKENTKLVFVLVDFVKNIVTGEASARQVGGFIEIANFSYVAFRTGLITFMGWIAFISLQLGIINLFPIPVLDGGQILVLSIEGLFRRDFSTKVKQIIMQIGFIIFAFLIVFAVLNDVARRLPNGWDSFLFWK